jgi:hypothetical protein
MSLSYTDDRATLTIPGGYASYTVQATNSGLATAGILMLVGEADGGPDYTVEVTNNQNGLDDNGFGPDQEVAVVTKYKSGPLVDAFKNAVSPSKDPDIVGAPARIVLVKSNAGLKATASLTKVGGGSYGILADKSWGKLGNLIANTLSASPAEVVPTTGSFTYVPTTGTVNGEVRVDGGAANAFSLAALGVPAACPDLFVSSVLGAGAFIAAGVAASGGVNRGVIPATSTITVTGNASLAGITFVCSNPWAVTPVVGDALVIPGSGALFVASATFSGGYIVTGVTATSITATKVADYQAGAVVGTVTNPITGPTVSGVVAVGDFKVFAPIVIAHVAGVAKDGFGKSLEFSGFTTGTDLLARACYVLGTNTPAAIVSTPVTPLLLTSASEYAVSMVNSRQADSVQETITAGGEIPLLVGYAGTSASLIITQANPASPTSPVQWYTTVAGGVGAGIGTSLAPLSMGDFATINDLVAYINAQPGYSAKVGTASLGQLPPSQLDQGTFNICGTNFGSTPVVASQPGRIKFDAYRFFTNIVSNSTLVQLGTGLNLPNQSNPNPPNPLVKAASGIPAVTSIRFLNGGTRGASTQATVQAAIDALQLVKGNFLVTCFSRNATLDIADGLSDSASTYLIDSVNAYGLQHCLAMSSIARRKNRIFIGSKRDTFVNGQTAAANLASPRAALTFQDVKSIGTNGITQFQPWMGAVKAASMQLAGGYKAIFNKAINIQGALQAAADFSDADDTAVTNALKAGMLIIKKNDGYRFVSDQTTYGRDANFVFNSIQAVYAADLVAMTTALRMEKAFVGQSLADVSTAVASSYLEGIMTDLMKLKLVAASQPDAPRGFRNARIRINGPVMIVEVEIFLATALYFVTVRFQVNQVQQST